MEDTNYFTELMKLNVSDHTEKKNGLTYLSWAYAWAEMKKAHPLATYTVGKNEKGVIYFNDGKTAWVEVSVTVPVDSIPVTHTEFLPIMDNRNRALPVEQIDMMHVNKAIQRALTKAIARHGIGLYIYAGEDLPIDVADEEKSTEPAPKTVFAEVKAAKPPKQKVEPTQDEEFEARARIAETKTAQELKRVFMELRSSGRFAEETLTSWCKEHKATLEK